MAHPQQIRDRAIEGLLLGQNVQSAAKYARVGRRTLLRWLNEDEAFREQLERGRQILFERHIAALAELTGTGVQRLRQILENDSGPPRDWMKACEIVMNQCRASEAAEIRRRMDQIEELLRERDIDGPQTNAASNPNA